MNGRTKILIVFGLVGLGSLFVPRVQYRPVEAIAQTPNDREAPRHAKHHKHRKGAKRREDQRRAATSKRIHLGL